MLRTLAALEMDKTLKYEDLLSIGEGAGYEKLPASYKVAIEVGVKCALKPHDVTDEDMNLLGKKTTRKKRFSSWSLRQM